MAIDIQHQGLVTVIETEELIKLVEKLIVAIPLFKEQDPNWDYSSQLEEYEELLAKLKDNN